jgi:hypothetical protein
MSGLREPEVGGGASMTVKSSQAATIALLIAISGVDINPREVMIMMTDISTTITVPELLILPAIYFLLPYQNARPKAPKIPKYY